MTQLLEEKDREPALSFFSRIHPVDQAGILVELSREDRQKLLEALPPESIAAILEHLEDEELLEVCAGLMTPGLAEVLDLTSPDVAADLLNDLPAARSQEILESMRDAAEVMPLLKHPDDSAGGLMTPDFPVMPMATTAANALDRLRLLGRAAEDISAVLVVDEEEKLFGTLSITRLALARPSQLVGEITDHDFIAVRPETDQEESARLMERYNLNQMPVIDEDGRLMGVILAEDMVDVVEEEATEDMYRMAGLPGERVFGSLMDSLRSRIPWLYLNLATAFLAALVISQFEATIASVVALAVFLPVVAGQGGIGGTQTVTLVVRSMALGEVPHQVGSRLLVREVALGVLNGLSLGIVVGVVGFAWKGNAVLGLVLGFAMMGNMMIGALAGAGVPLLLRRLNMDPAVSSAVFVTTFTDVLGFLLFLGLAAQLVRFLA
jgi:magnesium transporter